MAATTVEFAEFSDQEYETMLQIVYRAMGLDLYDDIDTCEMDLSAVCFHTPLRLEELLNTDDFNFVHDLVGIRNHLNRQTGQLENFFVPRFAKPETTHSLPN